ncbi:hypothetical protein OH720_12310 [Pseudomonas sp. WJP1]|uniref:hypothetical protein n=1 Tax=Pseudomonas sp. WJP1 TaxID=2986947 RepID=UPI0023496B9F|nr:hypothetical protein [Pseudomonas sp. WJP1]WCM53752.1 hypothetical protein OH720_12310 [Pseudomonas sp. WJP1]
MRTTVFIKLIVLFATLNGVAVSSAIAANLPYEISRISSACEGARAQAAAASTEGALAATESLGKDHGGSSPDAKSVKLTSTDNGSESAANASVNTSACDGLMTEVATQQFVIDPLHDKGMTGESAFHVTQPNAVPVSAVVWLFSSALLGFIVVANRRKI